MTIFKSVGFLIQEKNKVKDFKIDPKYKPPPPLCSASGGLTFMLLAILFKIHMLIIHANIEVCRAPGSLEDEG